MTRALPADETRRPVILIAEDEPVTRQALNRYLSIKGYTVLEAADGREALDLFTEHAQDVDLCLIDLNMPVVDGPLCIAVIREQAPDLPIFLLTGEIDQDHMPDSLRDEVQKCFLKPFDWSDLLYHITKALGRDAL